MPPEHRPVRFSRHARRRAVDRGVETDKVVRVVFEGAWQTAEGGRLKATKCFPYGQVSPVNNRFYRFQTVEVIFVQEATEIVIVTVKAYYSNEESA